MRSILVSHPHAAHVATGLAGALAREGMLAQYVTGLAAAPASLLGTALERLERTRPALHNRLLSAVPPDRVRSLALVEGLARGAGRLLPRSGRAGTTYDLLFGMHDRAVAALPWPRGTDAVYAYEDAALSTFTRARKRGVARLWDLPLPHHATLERMWREEFARWPGAMGERPRVEPEWKKRRKDAELELASALCVASRFTRESLESIGCRAPILTLPYGFATDEIAPRTARPDGPFTVIAVGSHDLRKGTPYLLEAWKRAALPEARLRLIGPLRLEAAFLAPYAGLFEHVPYVPKALLGEAYRGADLVAFPTLGDGFGLVIQEAMCAAVPVLTTPCGGGPECITDGTDGWLVPPRDIDALVARLREAHRDRERAWAMGQAARQRAERFTWREAGREMVKALAELR